MSNPLFSAGAATLAFLACAAGATASPGSGKVDAFLASQIKARPSHGRVSVILHIPDSLSSEQAGLLSKLGVKLGTKLSLIHAQGVTLPAKNLAKLVALPFVHHASVDAKVQKNDSFTVGRTGADVAFQNFGLAGKGVTIAVLDSGIGANGDLNDASGRSRVLAARSFIPGDGSTNDACGHGTHVAGIAAGDGAASSTPDSYRSFFGIARGANLLNARVLDATGSTQVSTLINAIQWVVANKAKYNVRVMNLSMGHPVGESYTTDPLCQAVEAAWKAGIVVVCSAGNDGRVNNYQNPNSTDNEGYGTAYGSVGSPGNDPYVITVGAMKYLDGQRNDDRIATYSSRGPSLQDDVVKPDIVAPGNKVVSLLQPLSYLQLTDLTNTVPVSAYRSRAGLLAGSNYFILSGTSMATPVVSGAAALLINSDNTLTPDTVKERLMLGADKWSLPDGTPDVFTFGAGYLDIPAALGSRVVATSPALSPTAYQDSNGTVSLAPNGVYGDRAMWGNNTALSSVYGQRAMWGNSTLSGSRAMWGNSVWGERAMWGNSQFSLNLLGILLLGE